jgi:hypothetical protein
VSIFHPWASSSSVPWLVGIPVAAMCFSCFSNRIIHFVSRHAGLQPTFCFRGKDAHAYAKTPWIASVHLPPVQPNFWAAILTEAPPARRTPKTQAFQSKLSVFPSLFFFSLLLLFSKYEHSFCVRPAFLMHIVWSWGLWPVLCSEASAWWTRPNPPWRTTTCLRSVQQEVHASLGLETTYAHPCCEKVLSWFPAVSRKLKKACWS